MKLFKFLSLMMLPFAVLTTPLVAQAGDTGQAGIDQQSAPGQSQHADNKAGDQRDKKDGKDDDDSDEKEEGKKDDKKEDSPGGY